MGLMDFFSQEAGQARRRALEEALAYYTPPELAGILGLAEMVNPVGAMERASGASQEMLAPGATAGDRLRAGGDMALEIAGVVAPAAALRYAGRPAAEAAMEGLLGWSPSMEAAGDAARAVGRDIIDRLNQPGPMPTLYSNPVLGLVPEGGGLEDILRAKYPEAKISITESPTRGIILNRIELPKGERGKGVGSRFMADLTAEADARGATISLSPSGDFGGSVHRLKDFYSRFGFVQNKGKNANYELSESMYRLPAPTDPAIQRADEVLGLLKSGRADEVTEEMLAMDDPVQYARMSQHLWDNYDLPMDFESRMARASNWPTPLVEDSIHGTLVGKDYTSFKGDGRIGQEVYVAPNTDAGHKLSAQFSSADQGRIMPLRTPAPLDTSTLDDRLLFEQLMDDKNRLDDFRMKGGYRPSGLPGWGDQWAIDTMNEAGIPAIKLHERDWVTSTAIFDPRNIRSRFARFDPRLAHLKNLNAALAAGVPLGLLSMSDEEQY